MTAPDHGHSDSRRQPGDWEERSPESARGYDLGINWEARFRRELPMICAVLGLPAAGGIVDAGCGTGRHAVALALRGYRVTGCDLSEGMLAEARRHAADSGADVRYECCAFDELNARLGGGADGVICIGNSLAAAGSEAAVRRAVDNFAAVLRPGGRLIVQVLNFPPMANEVPCVRGPRVSTVDGVEYVSVRLFHFAPDPAVGASGRADVTNVTLWNDDAWRQQAHAGTLYPVRPDELAGFCRGAGLGMLDTVGAYDRTPFDPLESSDLILIAEKQA